jgi:hypothetical protein
VSYARREGLSREEYVTIICRGYLVIGKPIPEEFWDEWEAICAKEAAPKTPEERLLEIPPEPLEVWAVMVGGGTFRLLATKPASNGFITLEARCPMTGMVDHCALMRPDGTVLAQIPFSNPVSALVAGDSLHVTLDAEQMVKYLSV